MSSSGVPRRSVHFAGQVFEQRRGTCEGAGQHHLPPIAGGDLLVEVSQLRVIRKRIDGGQDFDQRLAFTVSRSGCRQCQNGGRGCPRNRRTA